MQREGIRWANSTTKSIEEIATPSCRNSNWKGASTSLAAVFARRDRSRPQPQRSAIRPVPHGNSAPRVAATLLACVDSPPLVPEQPGDVPFSRCRKATCGARGGRDDAPGKRPATSARSTPSKIARKKCAPIPARTTFGDQAKTDSRERKTWRVPAATAVLRSSPGCRGPGCSPAEDNRNRFFHRTRLRGPNDRRDACRARELGYAGEMPSASTRCEPAGNFSTNARISVSAQALSLASIVSALPRSRRRPAPDARPRAAWCRYGGVRATIRRA